MYCYKDDKDLRRIDIFLTTLVDDYNHKTTIYYNDAADGGTIELVAYLLHTQLPSRHIESHQELC